mmetsp:Transcript_32960/g.104216  ORF Transcript_32960/g.104216 Transcript_32960/m.104216 type:complete len:117 (-) Transcript_32960:96-446(-)
MINQMPKSGKFVFKKNNSAGEGQNLLRDHLGQGKKGAGTAPVQEEDVFFDDIIDVPSEQSQKHAMPPLPPGLGPRPGSTGSSARLSKDGDGGDIRSNLKDFGKFLSPNHKIANRRK